MVKKLLSILIISLIISCGNLKHTQKTLASGNYDSAIDNTLKYLRKNRYGKKAAEYNQILFESYVKAALSR